MNILGISSFYHDSSACLIVNGNIVSAAQEERFTRIKNDSAFPFESIRFCLSEARLNLSDINHVVFYDKPFLKFDRLFETYLAYAPRGFVSFAKSMPSWLKEKLFQKQNIIKALNAISNKSINWENRLLFSEHHLSHAASAFYPSPFQNAAILTMDGVGEWTTTSIAIGNKNKIEIIKEIHFPHSIGLLYSAFTSYLGFKINSGEYKVMGLAPYGRARFVNIIKNKLIEIKDDGSFSLNMDYFTYPIDLKMTNEKFNCLFNRPSRSPESELTQFHMDIAASIQSVTQEIVVKIARYVKKLTGEANLCLAGGVALNCVANGELLYQGIFDKIWIQPAAGDAGGSVGAALAVYYLKYNSKRRLLKNSDSMNGSYLGPSYSQKNINKILDEIGAIYSEHSDEDIIRKSATLLANGKVIGWHQGRMEFGPRSLGSRSILADPRPRKMQKELNLKIKFRESFRPFAPSILFEDTNKWFNLDVASPYMLFVAKINEKKLIKMTKKQHNFFGIKKLNVPRSKIPACTHVDYSARVQTVHYETNPKFYSLIKYFKKITKCPVLLNTSFNVRGEPIVSSPKDAFNCFMSNGLDALIIGNSLLIKSDQNQKLKVNYLASYGLD